MKNFNIREIKRDNRKLFLRHDNSKLFNQLLRKDINTRKIIYEEKNAITRNRCSFPFDKRKITIPVNALAFKIKKSEEKQKSPIQYVRF